MSEEPEREMWQELTELANAFPEHYSKAKMWLEHAKKHHRPDRVIDALKAVRKALDSGANIVALPRYLDACLKPKTASRAGGAKMQAVRWWGEDGSYEEHRNASILQGREGVLGRALTEDEIRLSLHPSQGPSLGMAEEQKAELRALGVKVLEDWKNGLAELADNRHRGLPGGAGHLLAAGVARQDALDSESPF